jgi:hypothetical protein
MAHKLRNVADLSIRLHLYFLSISHSFAAVSAHIRFRVRDY